MWSGKDFLAVVDQILGAGFENSKLNFYASAVVSGVGLAVCIYMFLIGGVA